MPELPEVETIRRLLERMILGKRIESIDIFRARNIDTNLDEFREIPLGKTITAIHRKGKLLGFELDHDFILTSHLRMEGKYFFDEGKAPQDKHDILRFNFTDGSTLTYNDVRKFGRLGLYPYQGQESGTPFEELGPEPFTMDEESLYEGLQHHSGVIKEALMDQRLIAGIGNIYCDEILFDTGIHPLTPYRMLGIDHCARILESARKILNEAIQDGGSTVRSYHPGHDIDGMFQNHLHAYGKAGTSCFYCKTKLKKITVNGRGTTYCPAHQRNPLRPFVVGVTGPIHAGKSTVSAYFENKGYVLFDADKVAKEAYFSKPIQRKITLAFGEESYLDGKPNIPYIRNLVAQDSSSRLILNNIIHPFVINKAKALVRKANSGERILLDVPLLFPSGIDALCDVTLLVTAPEEKRKERLLKEGKDADALLALNASYPLEEAKEKASLVLDNSGTKEDLIKQLQALPF